MVNVGVPLSPLGFRGEVGFNRFDLGNNGNGNVRMLNGAANFILTPSSIMGAKPYLIGGVGVYNVKGSVDRGILEGGDVFIGSSGSDTRVGFNGGLGLTFGLGPVGTMLEARYVSVNGKNGGGSLTFVPVSFGITF
jgi:opacity protein-like surface antigen